MDLKPFFEIDLLNIRNNQINELKKFQKEAFDPKTTFSNATQLKDTTSFKNLLETELINPSDEFTKYFVKNLYPNRRVTESVLDNFKNVIKNGSNEYISEVVQNKLKTALKSDENNTFAQQNNSENTQIEEKTEQKLIITTEDELQGFYIVRAMIAEVVDMERIFWRDNQNYLTILLDNKNYKWFCRLYFNNNQKHIIVPDENKKDQRFDIKTLTEIFKFKSIIMKALQRLL